MSRMILYMAPTFPTGRETVGSISPRRNLTAPADFIPQSKMRQQRQSAAEEIDDRKPIARKGRVNKADKLTRAEKKARKKAQKEDAFFADGGNGGNGGNGSGGDGFDGGSKKRKKKKKKGRGLKIALIIVLILVLGIGGVIAAGLTVVKNTLDNVGRIELDPDLIRWIPI